ncbi:glycosyltransferase [Variovorax sp. YR216]|uniref:glycosyltransferase n=1 Tax=Variovorax sp. YR216 TaxID=1882828 RepID=UPI00089474BF|nr:glycosyltransferase [Variovorax sp. YR216]SEA73817.1 hypothetical protein SAMN05444680_103349 [Variovorax sp. YR216]
MTTGQHPSVSIIINTDGRAKSLAVCLESLRYLRYPNFEVVVVTGPTRDGTHELCESYGDTIKYADCGVRNLSHSRNVSIQISSGEFVAFLDDDSVPEPEWLDDVMPAFADPEVAVAGGFLHDHTGKSYQWTFGTLNRFGTADLNWKGPAPQYNFPGSFNYPHVMANSVFRRSAICEVGGFDEEYEYFLDESDIILRFVDAGFKVAQLDKGFIHHKYMPSHIRNDSRVLTSWYSVIKNKTYFSFLNARDHASTSEILTVVNKTIEDFRNQVHWAVGENKLNRSDIARFEEEVDRGLRDGIRRGLEGTRRLPESAGLEGVEGLTRFSSIVPAAEQRCFVFLSRTYPPGNIGGIGRYVHQLATETAKMGHQVHVLTAASDHDRVDFEEGVWIHRITPKEHPLPADLNIPQHLWNYSRTMLAEAREISDRRFVDSVCAPIWDLEGLAFLKDGEFPIVTVLQTTLATYLDSNPDRANDKAFMRDFALPVLEAEKSLFLKSDRVVGISNAIVKEIEESYGVQFDRQKLDLVYLGMPDWSQQGSEKPAPLPSDTKRVCFVGRLEPRKGADIFLTIVPDLLQSDPKLQVDVVGDDTIVQANGLTFRQQFEASHPEIARGSRIRFHGSISDARLRGYYQVSDVVVAPSRFESFGLVHLEAMCFGCALVGCAAGGMEELIVDGESGLLAKPGDRTSLLQCIQRLLQDDDLRQRLGHAARTRYTEMFQSEQMAVKVVDTLNMARQGRQHEDRLRP